MNKTLDSRAALLFALALSLFLSIFSAAQARAQSGEAAQQPPQSEPAQGTGARGGRGRDPLRELNLTFDQLQQIRAIREQNRDELRAIRQRLAEAFRALDEAVYSDNVNDALIEERARELGAAQAAVSRARALTELKIRRVLTPEQLNTLRAMRQQARAEGRKTGREDGLNARPLRRRARLGRGEGDGRALRGRRP
ncbi:MAG: Spy/CpxP family protein refolding chaperone [Acidobacteria bacterium]|nr:Spy/CpxP family protein refolding chaperone [Acidobacteriota bacterium]